MPQPVLSVLFACFVLLLLCTPQWVSAKDNLIWMEAVLPPFFIQSGPNQGQGYGDVITRILQEHLPGYTHEKINTNITRHFYMFKQGQHVCSVGLFKTPEREEFMYFSIPSFITLPPVIILKKKNIRKFTGTATISLDAVLGNNNLMIGLVKDRSYGYRVDEVLKRHQGQANLVEFTGQELSLNLFKMLMLGRLDGLIGLPEEALYQAEQMGIRDQIITLSLAENQHNYDGWMSSVACAKTPWGKSVIENVNKVLLELRLSGRYRSAYERWLDPNGIVAYRRAYKEVFLKATR